METFCKVTSLWLAQANSLDWPGSSLHHHALSFGSWPQRQNLLFGTCAWQGWTPLPLKPPRALIRPSGEDAMGTSCILNPPPGRWRPAAVRMPAVVRMPACHSRRFKDERPIGAATG